METAEGDGEEVTRRRLPPALRDGDVDVTGLLSDSTEVQEGHP